MTEKLCIKCKHHFEEFGWHRCNRPVRVDESLITGAPETKRLLNNLCNYERRDYSFGDRCGTAGKFFEPRKSIWENLSDSIRDAL